MKNTQDLQTGQFSNTPIVILLVLMYVIVAMSDNFKGIFVPFFKDDFGINNTQVGYVLTAGFLAYAVFQYVGGIFIEKIGYKKVIATGFMIGMASLALLITCKTYIILIVGLFGLNVGMAMFNVGVNTLGPVLTVASTAVLMNFVNFSYGASNTAIQKIVGTLLNKGIPWTQFYIFMLLCCGALLVYLLLIKIPYVPASEKVKYNKKDLFKNKVMYLYIAALGFYLASEYGIGNWFVNYMGEEFNLDADKRAFYAALFFGLETVGRLFGGFIVDRLGSFKSMLLFGCAASLLSAVGIWLGEAGLLIFSIAGLFYSIIYPTIITTAHGVFKEAASYVTGLMLMCGTLIAMVVNMLMGIGNDIIGVHYSYYSIAVCIAITTVAVAVIRRNVDGFEGKEKTG
ncbi:MFS transporter [Pelosinus propionicus]|uniref:Fucose permease n=1 Tax=Pelosinus propionicus DSM 13327 TaxID=1123291 RepID=A0A1I4MXF7_9FIRM|nr:MFS transporter [Pelosinus propionicus]SFM08004.1 Fucose permease [Pelosinus propionicus DSM 13327]